MHKAFLSKSVIIYTYWIACLRHSIQDTFVLQNKLTHAVLYHLKNRVYMDQSSHLGGFQQMAKGNICAMTSGKSLLWVISLWIQGGWNKRNFWNQTYFLVYQRTRPTKGMGTAIPGTEEPQVQHSLPPAIAALHGGSGDSNAWVSNSGPHESWHAERDPPKITRRKHKRSKSSLALLPTSTEVLLLGWRKAPTSKCPPALPWHRVPALHITRSACPHSASLFLSPPKSFCRSHARA